MPASKKQVPDIFSQCTLKSGIKLQGDWSEIVALEGSVALGSPEGDKNCTPFLQLLKKLVLVQNELFVGRNPVKNEQTCKGKNLLKNVVRCIRNATE